MDIVERIRQLCARNDISIAALERQLNFGNGTIGRWSTASPTVERLGKVADYFGVSVDYLTGREQQETLDATQDLATDATQDLATNKFNHFKLLQ